MEQTFVDLRQPRAFMDTITAIFEYIRSALRPLGLAILQIAGPYIGVAALAAGFYTQGLTGALSAIDSTQPDSIETFLVPMGLLYVALIISSVMVTAAVYSFIRFADRERRYPDVTEVRTEMRGSIGMIIGSTLLVCLMVVGALLFVILPGIWIAVPLSLVVMIRFIEGVPFGTAVSRAFRLVRDRWWWTFGILLLCYFAQAIAGSLFSMPATFLNMFVMITAVDGSEPPLILQIINGVFNGLAQIASLLFSALIIVATAAVYFAHVERLEATTLSQRVSDLAGGSQV